MPSIELEVEELNNLIGLNLSVEDLKKNLSQIALDVESGDNGVIKAEYNPNRPDYCTVEGVVRQLKGRLGVDTGLAEFKVERGSVTLTVDESVAEVRPFIVCGIARNVDLDHKKIQRLMKVQEDLHRLVGRNRLKAAIGVHDLDKVNPPFKYLGVKPESIKFTPLGEKFDMNLKEILEKHPKGVEYAHLVNKYERYPVIIDKNREVLSFPPIINGVLTQITEETRNLFLDITGYNMSNIRMALNILSTSLHDSGAILETVNVKYSDKTLATPDLKPEIMILNKGKAVKTLGLNLTDDELINCFSRVRFKAEKTVVKKDEAFKIYVPPYRFDILHEIDLVEEIAVGYGYDKIKPLYRYSPTAGSYSEKTKRINQLRRILIGLQLLEVVTTSLTNEENQFRKMRFEEEHVQLLNPVSGEFTIFRTMITPSLLKVFSENKHVTMPQQIFEIGDVLKIDERNKETKTRREVNIAFAVMDDTANYTTVKTLNEAFTRELGFKNIDYREVEKPFILEGRGSKVIINGVEVGLIGEIHPQVLNNFEIEYPVCAGEFSLSSIEEALKSMQTII
ncbi:MAG: phenylalanine--tRNA ligase subunit beta [Candidatus Odinarchaeota archaeon]